MGSDTGFEFARSTDQRNFWDDPKTLASSPQGVADRLTRRAALTRYCIVARVMGRDLDSGRLAGNGDLRVAIGLHPFGGFLSPCNRARCHKRRNRRNASGLVGH